MKIHVELNWVELQVHYWESYVGFAWGRWLQMQMDTKYIYSVLKIVLRLINKYISCYNVLTSTIINVKKI